MGKKTDKFIADLQKLLEDCETPIAEFSRICTEMNRLQKRLAEISDADSERRRELSGQANDGRQGQEGVTNQSLELEELYTTDPQLKAYDDELTLLNPQFLTLLSRKNTSKTTLKNAIRPFKETLDEFSTYITKKEKSKNPFRGKKSLKSAKDFIKQMDDMLDGLRTLANS